MIFKLRNNVAYLSIKKLCCVFSLGSHRIVEAILIKSLKTYVVGALESHRIVKAILIKTYVVGAH